MITETEKSEYFTNKVNWLECNHTLINFPRDIIGSRGVLLSYICRPINLTICETYREFIDKYVDRAPLTGQAYKNDAAEFHTYVVKFTSGDLAAEAKLVPHA